MRKYFTFLLSLLCILSLIGCDKKSMNYIISNKPSVTGIVEEVHGDYFIMYSETAEADPHGNKKRPCGLSGVLSLVFTTFFLRKNLCSRSRWQNRPIHGRSDYSRVLRTFQHKSDFSCSIVVLLSSSATKPFIAAVNNSLTETKRSTRLSAQSSSIDTLNIVCIHFSFLYFIYLLYHKFLKFSN